MMLTALKNQGLTPEEAKEVIKEIEEQVEELLDNNAPIEAFEQLLADYGLEPDYLMDILPI